MKIPYILVRQYLINSIANNLGYSDSKEQLSLLHGFSMPQLSFLFDYSQKYKY